VVESEGGLERGWLGARVVGGKGESKTILSQLKCSICKKYAYALCVHIYLNVGANFCQMRNVIISDKVKRLQKLCRKK